MPGISRLQTTIMQLNGDIISKNKLAEKLQVSAQTHRDAGNEASAQTEQDSADRYFKDAQDIESQIAGMQAIMTTKQVQKGRLDNQINELTRNFERDLDKLKSEQDSLV